MSKGAIICKCLDCRVVWLQGVVRSLEEDHRNTSQTHNQRIYDLEEKLRKSEEEDAEHRRSVNIDRR